VFFLGHLGIGLKLAQPLANGLSKKGSGLPIRWILLGTLLPDLLDKPLYYGMSIATGLQGAELPLITCTRTVGHTGLLLVAITAYAFFKKSRVWAALALGMATHLCLDNVSDRILHSAYPVLKSAESSAFLALTFPLHGLRFGIMPFKNVGEHMLSYVSPILIGLEVLGALFLAWEYWKLAYLTEIRKDFQIQRILRRKRKAKAGR
jgi:hypothetical protein